MFMERSQSNEGTVESRKRRFSTTNLLWSTTYNAWVQDLGSTLEVCLGFNRVRFLWIFQNCGGDRSRTYKSREGRNKFNAAFMTNLARVNYTLSTPRLTLSSESK